MRGRRRAPSPRTYQSLYPGRRRMSENHAIILQKRELTYSMSVLKSWSLTRIHGSSKLCVGGPSMCPDRALLKPQTRTGVSPLFGRSHPSYLTLCAISSTVTLPVSQILFASLGSTRLIRKSLLPPSTRNSPHLPLSFNHRHRHPQFHAIELQDGLCE